MSEEMKKVVSEFADDAQLVVAVAKAIKSKDRAALLALAPDLVKEAREDYEAVKAAMPEIKAGYKTSEFWLVVFVLAMNAGWLAYKGEPLPFDVNAAASGLVALYGIIRGVAKRPPPSAPVV